MFQFETNDIIKFILKSKSSLVNSYTKIVLVEIIVSWKDNIYNKM
jgi:hypothetical protein